MLANTCGNFVTKHSIHFRLNLKTFYTYNRRNRLIELAGSVSSKVIQQEFKASHFSLQKFFVFDILRFDLKVYCIVRIIPILSRCRS